jgi:hypothetical protein
MPGRPGRPDTETEILAGVAKVAEDLDAILDRLFANVAELKKILAPEEPGEPDDAKETP